MIGGKKLLKIPVAHGRNILLPVSSPIASAEQASMTF